MFLKIRNSLFTLIELIIAIVVLGILAAIVIPNISNVKDDAYQTAMKGNERNIQTAVDTYMLENNDDLPTDFEATIGKPQVVDLNKLNPKHLRNTPKSEDEKYYIDHNGKIFISTTSPPNYVIHKGTVIEWEEVKNASHYNIYKENSTLSGKANAYLEFVSSVKDNKFENAEPNTYYFISSVDKYGNETPASNPLYTEDGTYLYLDGINDYVLLPYGNGIDPSKTPITIQLWAKPENNDSVIIGTSNGDRQRVYISINEDGDWDIGIQGNRWLNNGETKKAELGMWHHLTLVLDGSKAELFVNGESVITKTYTSYTLNTNFRLGTNSTKGYFYKGGIKEVSIWERAKTKEEIYMDMGRLHNGNEEGLVGLWRLNDGKSNAVRDSSSNNYHGTIIDGAWIER